MEAKNGSCAVFEDGAKKKPEPNNLSWECCACLKKREGNFVDNFSIVISRTSEKFSNHIRRIYCNGNESCIKAASKVLIDQFLGAYEIYGKRKKP